MSTDIYNFTMERISKQLESHLFHHLTASDTSKINFYYKIVFELKLCFETHNLV